ncbi:DUF4150 domain-containing protein [Polyangium sorediatum]|uniref:DUF4150 domain-containing protein n=1 Tax=Polyangium sorediatum TaxID=889274 RepID=A0ABT6NP92_9BACT|nr:DUF4150 domain-containing protein [Polyangium sorediatum]MDI1430152.1 DUF4150 domain-containing protein [Polyangium sorediatum]
MADNEGLRTTGEAIVVSMTPDVCLTPPGMVPVPYQIIGRFSDGVRYADTVRMAGLPVMTMDSRLDKVYGDEAGTGGGIFSGVNTGWCRPITHSSTVRAKGHHITYHSSLYWMNCDGPDGPGNTQGIVAFVKDVSAVHVGPLGMIEGATNPPVTPETEPEKGFLDQVGGFFGGLRDGAVETAEGLGNMGVGAWNLTGGWLFDPDAANQTWTNLSSTVGTIVENPSAVWDGMTAPYVEAWSKGNYGEAIGRGTFEALSMLIGPKGLEKLGKAGKVAYEIADVGATADRMGDVAKAVDEAADAAKAVDKAEDAVDVAKTADGTVVTKGSSRFTRRGQAFELTDPGTAASGWKHIYDRHVDPVRFPRKSKFDSRLSKDDILDGLAQTIKHGKESSYQGRRVFEWRMNLKGTGYKNYRATMDLDNTIQTFHPLD